MEASTQDTLTQGKLNQDDLPYWLALWLTPGIGPSRFEKLRLAFPNLSELFKQSTQTLTQLKLPAPSIHALRNPNWRLVERSLNWESQANHHILCRWHPHYPTRLHEIYGAPPVLFVIGQPGLLAARQIALVGSRNPTITGLDNAQRFAQDLSNIGFCITSGLAHGVDAASHWGALKANGSTIGVLGTGIDIIYPAKNHTLADKIKEQGALVSEFPLGIKPQSANFPRRNRIISGLSLGVLVVEATIRSGSLITARFAMEQGREVFAIPGSIHNPLAKGCHALIQAGGKLVETITHITEELNDIEIAPKCPQPPKISADPLDIDQQKLVKYIGYEVTEIDTMIARSGFSAAKITAMLPILELHGAVRKESGGYMRI